MVAQSAAYWVSRRAVSMGMPLDIEKAVLTADSMAAELAS